MSDYVRGGERGIKMPAEIVYMVHFIIKTNPQSEAPQSRPVSAVLSTVTDCEGCWDPPHPTSASGFHQASSALCTCLWCWGAGWRERAPPSVSDASDAAPFSALSITKIKDSNWSIYPFLVASGVKVSFKMLHTYFRINWANTNTN